MSSVRAICLPSSDSTFRDVVEAALAADPAIESPAGLEDALRPTYPEVRVRPRELSGELLPTWYVYRDRDFPVPNQPGAPAGAPDPSDART